MHFSSGYKCPGPVHRGLALVISKNHGFDNKIKHDENKQIKAQTNKQVQKVKLNLTVKFDI